MNHPISIWVIYRLSSSLLLSRNSRKIKIRPDSKEINKSRLWYVHGMHWPAVTAVNMHVSDNSISKRLESFKFSSFSSSPVLSHTVIYRILQKFFRDHIISIGNS